MLIKFKALVTVVPVNDKTKQLSLASDFDVFEDAIQYYAAIENGLNTLITRNLKDYTKAKIKVLSAQQFLRSMI